MWFCFVWFLQQLAEVAMALQESNFSFLWVIKEAHIGKLLEGFCGSYQRQSVAGFLG